MSAVEQIQRLLDNTKKRWKFTLEEGVGETYYSPYPVLYGHSTYEHSSVLAGRPQRVFVAQWNDRTKSVEENWKQAREELKAIKKFKYEDNRSASTHIPIDQLVAHLPDDTDY